MSPRSVGVEEEFLLVEPGTGRPRAVAGTILRAARPELEAEFRNSSWKPTHGRAGPWTSCTASCAGAGRRQPKRPNGSALTWSRSPPRRSRSSRSGPWLAALLALSANSPYWQGRESSYASFRYQVWGRWPSSGPPGPFGTPQAYRETIEEMVESGTIIDPGMVYFNARLSERYPPIEVRIADVCLRAGDAVLIAGLVRALVETEARAWRDGKPAPRPRTELLRLAAWRASRSGLDGALLSPRDGKPEPTAAVVAALAEHCREALADAGDAGAACPR